ncbi:MAG: hypothetical protein ABSD20_07530 [Terriglobales bacterium]|jgi:hypothetical protein
MPEGSLNSRQARNLLITCQHIDKLLADMEDAFNSSDSRKAFPQYIPDLAAAQGKVIQDFIARIRSQLLRILDGQGIARPQPSIPVTRSLHVVATFIQIAVEELRPRHMRRYGEISEPAAMELNGIVAELMNLSSHLDRYVAGGQGEVSQERLDRMDALRESAGGAAPSQLDSKKITKDDRN